MSVEADRPIRLLIVDDHNIVREGLKMLLESRPKFEVVGEADSEASGIAAAAQCAPDVILLDIRLPDGNGFEVCRKVKQMPNPPRVLMLTSAVDDHFVLDAISAGADGYILKRVHGSQLVDAIERVAAGEHVLDPSVTGNVFRRVRDAGPEESLNELEKLSPQERRIAELIAVGHTNKEIATEMGLSDNTVKNYLKNVFEKLNFTRRSQIAALVVKSGKSQS